MLFITLIDINKETILKDYFKNNNNDAEKYIRFQKFYKWDSENKLLFKNEQIIKLTNKEKELLDFFIKHINNNISREIIYSSFPDSSFTYNSLLSLIKRLRKRTSADFIETVYSKGYILKQ